MKNKKILVIVAHLDDEVFGLGGTLLKLSKDNQICIISMCHGWDGWDEKRIEAFQNVTEHFGADTKYHIFQHNDVSLESVATRILMDELNKVINVYQPEVLFTHTHKDTNPDHRIVAELGDVLARRGKFQKVYRFSVPGNSDWQSEPFKPNAFFDISDVFKEKLSLLQYYKEYKYPDPLSWKKILAKDEYLGSLIDLEKAEGFEIRQEIN